MNNNNFYKLCLSFLVFWNIQTTQAQNIVDKVLQATNVAGLTQKASQLKQEAEQRKALAWRIADEKGWAKRLTYSNGETIELMALTENGFPIYYATESNLIAAESISANKLWNGGSLGLSLSGANMTINGFARLGEWDGGATLTTHQEFSANNGSTVVQRDGATTLSDHATHVAGTMVGFGVRPSAKGMSFQAQLDAHDWTNDASEMALAALRGMLISNHSYGTIAGWNQISATVWYWYGNPNLSEDEDANFGYYDSRAKEWDQIALDAPYFLICKSAGNDRGDGPASGATHFVWQNGNWTSSTTPRLRDGGTEGYDCISTYGNAKNILTVGAVNDVAGGYTSASGVVMSSFSGWGPTDDGRIKPDVCGNGVGLESSASGSNTTYATLSGTSMATPNVSGALLLLQQHYQNLFGNGNFMRSATLKGLAIHTADEAGTSAGPDYKFGWGLVNVATAAQAITDAKANTTSFVFEKTLPNNASQTMQIISNGQPLRVTICWTDRPGTPVTPQVNDSPTPMLVNDLDSRITYDGTTTFPWILDPANPNNAATRGDNIRDNVEQILLSSTTNGGVYTLTIGHKGTLQGTSQAYSIWITGATSVTEVGALPAMLFTTSGIDVSEGATTGTLNCRKYQDVTATLQINKAYTGTAQVNVQATGTASSGADYSILSGASLTFSGATTSQPVVVRVFDDNAIESAETIQLAYTLSGNSNVLQGTSNQVFTITVNNDDTNPLQSNNTNIETAVSSSTMYVGANSTAHFYSTAGKLMGTLENLTTSDLGCTTLQIDAEGTGATPYINTANASRTTQKTHKLTFGNTVASPSYRLTLYYTSAEIAGWETATGRVRGEMTLIGSPNAMNAPVATAQYAFNTITSNILNNTAFSIRGNFIKNNVGFAGCVNEVAVGPLSVEKQEIADLLVVYPNPMHDYIKLDAKQNSISAKTTWQLLNATGQAVWKHTGKEGEAEKALNVYLKKATQGLYLLHVQDNQRYFSTKIIKQ